MSKPNIYFMSGFPRAGSTLLMNILAQNPKLHGTPTSGLISSVLNLRDSWNKNDAFKSNVEDEIYPHIKNMLTGMIYGYYYDQLKMGQIPIDKSRGWVSNIDLLDELFDTKVKFVYPIRNVVDVLISFEKIKRKSQIIKQNVGDEGKINDMTTIGRSMNLLKPENVVGLPILELRELIYRGETDRLMFVVFDDLLKHPEIVMRSLYSQMDLEYFSHDFNNVKQVTKEYDIMHGFPPHSLHKIKEGKVLSEVKRDLTIFDDNYINEIENVEYKDITELINSLKKI